VLKSLTYRLGGLLLATAAFIPASTSLLKGVGGYTSNHVLHTEPFRWTAAWMPAIHYPISSLHDLLWSLPGIAAVCVVGFGLSTAFGVREKKTAQRWEESP
jgi:hypothetical protein